MIKNVFSPKILVGRRRMPRGSRGADPASGVDFFADAAPVSLLRTFHAQLAVVSVTICGRIRCASDDVLCMRPACTLARTQQRKGG